MGNSIKKETASAKSLEQSFSFNSATRKADFLRLAFHYQDSPEFKRCIAQLLFALDRTDKKSVANLPRSPISLTVQDAMNILHAFLVKNQNLTLSNSLDPQLLIARLMNLITMEPQQAETRILYCQQEETSANNNNLRNPQSVLPLLWDKIVGNALILMSDVLVVEFRVSQAESLWEAEQKFEDELVRLIKLVSGKEDENPEIAHGICVAFSNLINERTFGDGDKRRLILNYLLNATKQQEDEKLSKAASNVWPILLDVCPTALEPDDFLNKFIPTLLDNIKYMQSNMTLKDTLIEYISGHYHKYASSMNLLPEELSSAILDVKKKADKEAKKKSFLPAEEFSSRKICTVALCVASFIYSDQVWVTVEKFLKTIMIQHETNEELHWTLKAKFCTCLGLAAYCKKESNFIAEGMRTALAFQKNAQNPLLCCAGMWGLRLCLLNHIEHPDVAAMLPYTIDFALESMEGSHMRMVQSAFDCITGLTNQRKFLEDQLERVTKCIASAMKRPSFPTDGKAWLLLTRVLQALISTFDKEFIQYSSEEIIPMLLKMAPSLAENDSPYILPVCECISCYLSADSELIINESVRESLCDMAIQAIQVETKAEKVKDMDNYTYEHMLTSADTRVSMLSFLLSLMDQHKDTVKPKRKELIEIIERMLKSPNEIIRAGVLAFVAELLQKDCTFYVNASMVVPVTMKDFLSASLPCLKIWTYYLHQQYLNQKKNQNTNGAFSWLPWNSSTSSSSSNNNNNNSISIATTELGTPPPILYTFKDSELLTIMMECVTILQGQPTREMAFYASFYSGLVCAISPKMWHLISATIRGFHSYFGLCLDFLAEMYAIHNAQTQNRPTQGDYRMIIAVNDAIRGFFQAAKAHAQDLRASHAYICNAAAVLADQVPRTEEESRNSNASGLYQLMHEVVVLMNTHFDLATTLPPQLMADLLQKYNL